MKNHLKASTHQEDIDITQSIMDDIEQSLIKGDIRKFYGIDEFQKLFEKKKLVNDAISEYHDKNKMSKENIVKAQQRLVQIEQLADKAEKQSVLIKNQIEKINDAHMMTKILTIEKMIKVKMQHDEMMKRKNTIFRIREQKHRASLVNRTRNEYKSQKLRQLSLIDSKNLKEVICQKKYETIEMKRSRADRVKQQKQRMKDRIKRYEQFKIDQAKKNYQTRLNQLKETLEEREQKLQLLYRDEVKQQKNFQTTEQVTKQYLGSLFPTETI